MKTTSGLFTVLALGLSLTACFNEDTLEDVPDHMYSFACVDTDSKGLFSRLKEDSGESYTIRDFQMTPLVADTTYRLICTYSYNGDGSIDLNQATEIISGYARRVEDFADGLVKEDPMNLSSAWVSGGYLNIILAIKCLDKSHRLAVVDYSTDNDVIFGFYHDENGDTRSYDKYAYVSVPLSPYNLDTGDTLRFYMNGYDGKTQNFELTYK